jgi:RHS repeat-associated protein
MALKKGSGHTEVYAYDDADKLLNIKVNGVVVKSFSYDLAGRTTGITDAGGTTSLVYDYEDRVTSISRPGMTTNTFAYNGFGARVGKTDSGGTTTYLRSGTSVVAPVVSVSGAESATFTPGISERRGTGSRFYHGDIKNFVEQTNDQGNIVSSQQYDAFGNVVSSGGTWNGPFAYGGRFGYQTDGDTTLHLLGHRYYDSTTGRFLSRDPIADGRNWYVYCSNNPARLADPAGLAPVKDERDIGVGKLRRLEGLPARSKRALDIVNDPKEWRKRWRNRDGSDQTDPCPNDPSHGRHGRYTDCGRFVHAVVDPDDPDFPESGSWAMVEYVTDPDNGWEHGRIGDGGMRPGDVLLRGGHVAILVDIELIWDPNEGEEGAFVPIYHTAEASLGDHGPERRRYRGTGALDRNFDYWARPGDGGGL